MPIFDFRCLECGHTFEAHQHISDKYCGQRTKCELCGSFSAARLYTTFNKFVEMAGFREGFDPALDRYIHGKHQMKEEMKMVEQENYDSSGLGMKLDMRS